MNDAIIEVRDLCKYFGRNEVIRDLSFSVHQGEIFAFLGRNGTGKTTTIQILLGMLEPTRGSCSIFGCDSRHLTPAVRQRIGYLAEAHHLPEWMQIGQLASFTAETHPLWDARQFTVFLDYFGLDMKSRIGALSLGQRAQTYLSLTLACGPEVLIMDDPTLGVDAIVRRDFLRGMVDLVATRGRTVLISTHNLADVEHVADRIAIIDGGTIRVLASLAAFKENVVKYHMAFAREAPDRISVPRAVDVLRLDKDLTVTVVRPGPDVDEALSHLGAATTERVNISLEDAFVDYTGGGRQRRVSFAGGMVEQEVGNV